MCVYAEWWQIRLYCNSLTPTRTDLCTKLFLKSHRAEHASPLLKPLYWLPIKQRFKHKIACLCYQIITITGTAPQNLAELVHIYVLSRSPRSCSDDNFSHPHLEQKKEMAVVP